MHRQIWVVALCVGCGNVNSAAPDGSVPGDALEPTTDVLGGTLRTGCVLALHMDEASWTGAAGEVKDDCGNDNPGTVSGTGLTTVAGGAHGRAGSFSGQGCVDIADAPSLHGTTGLTMSAWIFPTQLDGGVTEANGVISKRIDAGDEEEYSLSVWLNHDAYVDLDGQDDRFPSRSAIALNTWTQVTVVYDGTQAVDQRAQIYINGMLDSAHSETSASLTAFTSALHIGCMPAPAMTLEQGFVGELDEVAIWNRALTALEIAQWNVNTRPATASP